MMITYFWNEVWKVGDNFIMVYHNNNNLWLIQNA